MEELTAAKANLAAVERHVAELEAQLLNAHEEVNMLRAQRSAAHDTITTLRSQWKERTDSLKTVVSTMNLPALRADDEAMDDEQAPRNDAMDVEQAPENDSDSGQQPPRSEDRGQRHAHRRTETLRHHSRTDKDHTEHEHAVDEWRDLQPFGQNEEVVPFNRTVHGKLLKGATGAEILPDELEGAVDVPYRAWQQCWGLHSLLPYTRLQFLREHQSLAPQNPGDPGIVYVPSWLKQAATGLFVVAFQSGSDSWTFCGRYEAELVDVFKPQVWDAESDDTKISWARFFADKIGIRDQLACARIHLALRDREDPSMQKCEREISRRKFSKPTAGDILRSWKHCLALPLVYRLNCVGWDDDVVEKLRAY